MNELSSFAGVVMLKEKKTVSLSACGAYRYKLERRWSEGEPLVWIMLNPSVADADIDDPTIRRVRGFTRREGYPALMVLNVWSYRATNPMVLHENRLAYEPENISIVQREVKDRDVIIGWGNNIVRGPAYQRICLALRGAKSVRCLGLTKLGNPKHPLMVAKQTPLIVWEHWT